METKQTTMTEIGRNLAVILFIIIVLFSNWNHLRKKKAVQLKINFDNPVEHEENWDEFGLVSRLSIQEFRKFPGCEHYSDEEANSLIDSLYKLGIIGYNVFGSQTEQSIFIVDKY